MNRRILTSLLIIGMVIAAMTGATLAWFTDFSEEFENVFTAGTLTIAANETFDAEDLRINKWNPGDCFDKVITVEITGNKNTYLKAEFEMYWEQYNEGESVWESWTPPHNNINWTPDPLWADWQELTITETDETFYFYVGTTEGILAKPDIVGVLDRICFDGSDSTNEFQGKRFTMKLKFHAIQTTNDAEKLQWKAAYLTEGGLDGWYEVRPDNGGWEYWDGSSWLAVP